MIFSITRTVLLMPWVILCYLGEPFKFEAVGLAQKSDATIRGEYIDKKGEHYIPRIFIAMGLVVFTTIFLLLWIYVWSGMFLIPTYILIGCVIVDAILMSGRYAFFSHKSKEAEKVTGNALALTDSHVWKDTSLNGLLKRAAEERKAREEQVNAAKAKKKPAYDEED